MYKNILKVFSRNNDILVFQLINWITTIAWYYFFTRKLGADFSLVASSEVAFTFLNIYLTQISFRLHGSLPNKTTEIFLIWLRLFCIFIALLLNVTGLLSLIPLITIIMYCIVPTHLPILLGFKLIYIIPLLVRLPLIVFLNYYLNKSLGIYPITIIYYLPLIFYGIFIYLYCFFKLNNRENYSQSEIKLSTFFNGGYQFVATIASNQLQAYIVSFLVSSSSSLALIDRLVRSLYSFIYPYLVREKFISLIRSIKFLSILLMVIIFLGIFFHFFITQYFSVFLPVLLDIYTTIFAAFAPVLDVFVLLVAFAVKGWHG